MAKKIKKQEEEVLFDLVEAKQSTQNFVERYQNYIIGAVATILVVVGIFFLYKLMWLAPKEKEAMEELYRAEIQFEQDSFARALEDPGEGYKGFIDIADDYSFTKAGNLANYYAGISYLKLGRYEAAIAYLKDFSPAGKFTPILKHGTLGDAYSELGETDHAIAEYKKAVKSEDNEFVTPYYLYKLGMLYRSLGKNDDAGIYFKTMQKNYPTSTMTQQVEKYISD